MSNQLYNLNLQSNLESFAPNFNKNFSNFNALPKNQAIEKKEVK